MRYDRSSSISGHGGHHEQEIGVQDEQCFAIKIKHMRACLAKAKGR
jgi:hypothetical protein